MRAIVSSCRPNTGDRWRMRWRLAGLFLNVALWRALFTLVRMLLR